MVELFYAEDDAHIAGVVKKSNWTNFFPSSNHSLTAFALEVSIPQKCSICNAILFRQDCIAFCLEQRYRLYLDCSKEQNKNEIKNTQASN